MTDSIRYLLAAAARAVALSTLVRAKGRTKQHQTMTNTDTLMTDPTPTPEAQALTGELLAKMVLGSDGQPYGETPEEWDANATPEQVISLQPVKFKIIEPDARALARELGAVDPDHEGDAEAVIVEFDSDETAAEALMGRYVVLEVAEGVTLTFLVWFSAADRDAPVPEGFELGSDAVRNPALDTLGARQALLVQVFAEDDLSDESSVQP
ncbi:hypothetical protein WKW77_12170 [Variovorax ureilyticus]|uniref:Uncharacterized protein n=1 Tax=Variovorax ureilyticus TaxID=1836198 RepID=A0ABU8VDU3_9BURK